MNDAILITTAIWLIFKVTKNSFWLQAFQRQVTFKSENEFVFQMTYQFSSYSLPLVVVYNTTSRDKRKKKQSECESGFNLPQGFMTRTKTLKSCILEHIIVIWHFIIAKSTYERHLECKERIQKAQTCLNLNWSWPWLTFFLLRAVYHISQKTNLCYWLFLCIPPSQLSFRQYRLWPFY